MPWNNFWVTWAFSWTISPHSWWAHHVTLLTVALAELVTRRPCTCLYDNCAREHPSHCESYVLDGEWFMLWFFLHMDKMPLWSAEKLFFSWRFKSSNIYHFKRVGILILCWLQISLFWLKYQAGVFLSRIPVGHVCVSVHTSVCALRRFGGVLFFSLLSITNNHSILLHTMNMHAVSTT